MIRILSTYGALLGLLLLAPLAAEAQTRRGLQAAAAARYLSDLNADLRRSYYDPNFRGVNLDAAYDSARAELKAASTDPERWRAIERYLERLDDSHTYFIAPWRLGLSDYHFGIRFHGAAAYVVSVDAGSSAETAGLRRGDHIVSFAGQSLSRDNYYRVVNDFLSSGEIRPLALTVRAPDRSTSQLTVTADTTEIYKMKGARFRQWLSQARDSAKIATSHVQATVADSIFVWRLPQFRHADKGIKDVLKRARQHRVLIMDLRGNGGGSVETLTKLVGNFVDEEVLVGDLHTRTGSKKYVAEPADDRFDGRMFILVDSETGSAAEIFARLMQLQQKATVIGDRTAGAVLAANMFQYDEYVGAAITVSDFALYNGERLEKVGVQPDVPVLIPAEHIAAGTDPVLSLALLRAGARISPANAVKVLPVR
jgi:carboxyl-terminal processing protease